MVSCFVNISVGRVILHPIAENSAALQRKGNYLGFRRFASLLHKEAYGEDLEGCICWTSLSLGCNSWTKKPDSNLQQPEIAWFAELLLVATLGDGESCSPPCFKNYSTSAGKKKEAVNKTSADKSFALSSLGRCSKAVRLTFCIELQLSFSFACCFLLLGAGSHWKLLAFKRVQLLMLM